MDSLLDPSCYLGKIACLSARDACSWLVSTDIRKSPGPIAALD